MPVEIGKHAGFCFGVKSAVDMAFETLKSGETCWVLGSLIHNKQVMQKLMDAGLRVTGSQEKITGGTVLLRSHGVPPDIESSLLARGIKIIDATCPTVKRIHKLVGDYSAQGDTVIIAGQADHPEVQATAARCKGPVLVIPNEHAAAEVTGIQRAMVVAQTTLTQNAWEAILGRLKASVEALTIANTICGATQERQREAEMLAKRADVVLVVGGYNSANTRALYETCRKYCARTFFIESAADIPIQEIQASDYIAITAGASTPEWSLKEVATRMNDLDQNVQQEANEQLAAAESGTPMEETMEAETPVEATGADNQEEAASAPVEAAEPEALPPVTTDEVQGNVQATTPPLPEAGENSFMADIEATLVTIRTGQTISGTVVQITEDEVCVNIGYKSDGLIKRSDLVSTDIKVGDSIEVEVVKVNDGEGNVLLSQRNIVNRRNWDALMAQYENDNGYVMGTGKEAVKGGLIANVNGIRAFIPASQLSQRYVEHIEDFVGQELKLKIIEVDKPKHRIVCSRKAVIMEEAAAKKKEIWDKLGEGEIVSGVVRRLTDFGAFVDIGGVDGLVHVTDLSWGRVKHPSEVVSPNQEILVKILSLNPERERIQLGYKQTQSRPWDIAEEKYLVGSIVEGRVVRITTFGAFVELEPGLDGLVHISQCALTRIAKVEDAVQVGQVIRVKVLGVDPKAKRISLSIRAAMEEEAFNYSNDIPGDEMMFSNASTEEYAAPVDYSAYQTQEAEQAEPEQAAEPEQVAMPEEQAQAPEQNEEPEQAE